MIPTPAGSTQSEPSLSGRDAGAMIDWLCTAFGLIVHLRADGTAAVVSGGADDPATASSRRPGRSTAHRRSPNPAS